MFNFDLGKTRLITGIAILIALFLPLISSASFLFFFYPSLFWGLELLKLLLLSAGIAAPVYLVVMLTFMFLIDPRKVESRGELLSILSGAGVLIIFSLPSVIQIFYKPLSKYGPLSIIVISITSLVIAAIYRVIALQYESKSES